MATPNDAPHSSNSSRIKSTFATYCCFYLKKNRHEQELSTLDGDPMPPVENQIKPPLGKSHENQTKPPLGKSYKGSEVPAPTSPSETCIIVFSYDELFQVTKGFSDEILLGKRSFGNMYKGVLLDGKEVAVRQWKITSSQELRGLDNEVNIASRLRYKHLMSLVGFCLSSESSFVVYDYEFMSNNSLQFQLHGRGRSTLDWGTRIKIALGVAKGLSYLHDNCDPMIIHGDIKASNVLLDYTFEAKVADFTHARMPLDNRTYVSTKVMGTIGYIAPEYATSGKMTDKSDVFSFGVILLELITGRRPVDGTRPNWEISLVEWARPLLVLALEERIYDELVDERLGKNLNPNEMARMIECAACCIRHSANRRPLMRQIVRVLSFEDLKMDNRDIESYGHNPS